jgi:hypothetical protein
LFERPLFVVSKQLTSFQTSKIDLVTEGKRHEHHRRKQLGAWRPGRGLDQKAWKFVPANVVAGEKVRAEQQQAQIASLQGRRNLLSPLRTKINLIVPPANEFVGCRHGQQ